MGGQWEKGSAVWDAANFFSLWLMFHLAMTPQDVYVCIFEPERASVCFDVARESGNVKYARKVRTDKSFMVFISTCASDMFSYFVLTC